jgi:hypothetical protein
MALLGFLFTDLHRLRRFFGASLGFFGTPEGIPDFHEVSCVSGFHPNRGRDRYRYRDRERLFHHRTQPPHSLTAFEIAGSARISIRQNPMFTGLC